MSPATAAEPPPFTARAQRLRANQLGIWTFLATEVLFFGGLFVAYAVYRCSYPRDFALASRRMDLFAGTLNTAILLTSSLGVALAELAARRGAARALRRFLLGGTGLGLGFVALKLYEYREKFGEHLVPGSGFVPPEGAGPASQLFFLLYFAMTGLHLVHLLVGLGVLGWLWHASRGGRFTPDEHQPVVVGALYWHFVDCVWVFLYPLLYLVT